MRCQNCGKKEVNFHYSSNINGVVTERHLCSECAAKMGYGDMRAFEPEEFFDSMFSGIFGNSGFMPSVGINVMFPFFSRPQLGILNNNAFCAPEAPGMTESTAAVDVDMKKRREINIIREQMRQAADKEDFEQAAKLRDKLREMENRNG